MKLELGSGRHPTPGFVHLDANPNLRLVGWRGDDECDVSSPHADYRTDVRDLSAWEDESVEEIRAVDILEHLSYRSTDAALAEWARVLAPGGRLFVQVPDFGRVLEWVALEQAGGEAHLLNRAYELHDAGVCPEPTRIAALNVILLGGHADGDHVRPGEDFRLNAHFALFTQQSLEAALERAGFAIESCVTNRHPNLMVWAIRKP